MTAPYAKRLKEQIAAAVDPGTRGELTAYLGCYLARSGDLEASAEICGALRREFGTARYPRVSLLIMCLEAIHLYFQEQSPRAQDRLKRANLLSLSLGDRELIAFTAAWQAHLHFNFDEYLEFGVAMRLAHQYLDESNSVTRLRLSILLGDAAILTRQLDSSRKWYGIARDLAVRLGDHAAIGAITYNRAALSVYTARVMRALGSYIEDEFALLKVEVESAVNYQAVAGLRSLDHLLGVARTGRLMLLDLHKQALPEIEILLNDENIKLTPNDQAILRFDRIIASGGSELALRVLESLCDSGYRSVLTVADAGDRVIVLSRASETLGDLDDALPGSGYGELLESSRREFAGKMHNLKESIRGLL